MKYLLLAIAIVLTLLTLARVRALPDMSSKVPVIYWVTDVNPARTMQVELFNAWLIKNGVTARGGGPGIELRLDTANRTPSKIVIQAVSGVGGDVIDTFPAQLQYFGTVGILKDVTDEAKKLGFATDQTWPALAPAMEFQGRQYRFPCNAGANLFWVNKETFTKFGLDPPPRRWTLEQFEEIGKKFIAAANPKGQRQKVFFIAGVPMLDLMRTMGLTTFNETMTASCADDPRYVRMLELNYKWTYVDHLIPSLADQQDFATIGGYLGPTLQLFNDNRMAMFQSGRYALVALRDFNKTRKEKGLPLLSMSVSELPYDSYPSAVIGSRSASVYKGGKHPELAAYFLAFLASEDYNMQIVRDADALPPNPKYTLTREYLRPADHPEEWGLHEVFSDVARDQGIVLDFSPFVLSSECDRITSTHREYFMNGLKTAREAASDTAGQINQAIQRQLAESPALRPEYDRLCALQKQIDRRKANRQPIPAGWITNPFHLRYYADMGWLEKAVP